MINFSNVKFALKMIPSIKYKVLWSYGRDLSDPTNHYQTYIQMKCVVNSLHYLF